MGFLARFQLPQQFVSRFPHFVETGIGRLGGILYAANHAFSSIHTIDVHLPAVEHVRHLYSNDLRVTAIHARSEDALRYILRWPPLSIESVFFWLDAHVPGFDTVDSADDWFTTTAETDNDVRWPLERELAAIRQLRPDGNYAILMDDLRVYCDYDWEAGPVPDEFRPCLPLRRDLGFLNQFRDGGHDVKIYTADAGYALVKPSGAPEPILLR